MGRFFMKFKEKINSVRHGIWAAAVSSPAVCIFVLAAGVSQLFYKYIPNAIRLNVLFSFSVILLCADRIKSAAFRIKAIIFCIQLTAFAAVYITELVTLNTNIELACLSLIYLYGIFALIAFFPAENFLAEFKRRLIHIFVSLLFFAAIYLALFITVFFVNAVFDFDIVFTESVIFRITNAAATVTALTVFTLYRSKPLEHSRFFTLMFQKLLSVLLPPLGIFGLVYLTKCVIFPRSAEDMYFPRYYFVLGLLVLCLLMIQHFENRRILVRLMLCMLALASLLFIAALLKVRAFVTVPRYNTNIGFSVSGKSPAYEIAVNGLLALYFFYAALSGKNITAMFRMVIAAVALILFLPLVGFFNYAYFKEGQDIIKPQNALTAFERKRERENTPKVEQEYFYESYSFDDEQTSKIDRIIDTAGYSALLLKVELCLDSIPAVSIPYKAQCQYKRFQFSMAADGKSIKITDTEDNSFEIIDFYTRIKADHLDSGTTAASRASFIHENQKMKIIVTKVVYRENDYARIIFDAYIKTGL